MNGVILLQIGFYGIAQKKTSRIVADYVPEKFSKMIQEYLLILNVTFSQAVKIRMIFKSTFQKSAMQFHLMKRTLLQHEKIQFYPTLTAYNTKKTLPIASLKMQINVSFAISLTVQTMTSKT